MVKHIVMWKLKPTALGADKKDNAVQMKQKLEALRGVVPGALKMEVGINHNPNGFDVVLYSGFNDQAALDGYQIHPEHVLVKTFVHAVMQDRVVADYTV